MYTRLNKLHWTMDKEARCGHEYDVLGCWTQTPNHVLRHICVVINKHNSIIHRTVQKPCLVGVDVVSHDHGGSRETLLT